MVDAHELVGDGHLVEGRRLLVREEDVGCPYVVDALRRHHQVFMVAQPRERQSGVNPRLTEVDVDPVVLNNAADPGGLGGLGGFRPEVAITHIYQGV